MIVLLFVEGERDFYFLYHVLKNVKNFIAIDTSNGFDDYVYYQYKRLPRLVVKNNLEKIILLRHKGKINAISGFIESLNLLLRSENNVNKMLLIVDRDEDIETKSKIVHAIESMSSRFELNSLKTIKDQNYENFETLTVQNRTKQIKIGIMDISPNLDHLMATFIKENHVIPISKLTGDYDQIIENTIEHLQVDLDGLSKLLSENYKSHMNEYLNRTSIKPRICKFFDITVTL